MVCSVPPATSPAQQSLQRRKKKATEAQIKALEKQRKFVYDELNPTKVNAAATAADVENAKARLALQATTDPALLQARYQAENDLANQAGNITSGAGDAVANQAAAEALQSGGDFDALKKRLIDTALTEIDAGASLPNDLQAELVKAGLERGSQLTGSAATQGLGGQATRKFVGEAGIALQAQRQGRAAALGEAAQNLEARRASILGSLFPSLKQTQLSNLQATSGVVGLSEALKPKAGLTGEDIANLWLGRVGATSQLSGRAADAAGALGPALAQIYNQGIGGATNAIAGAGIPSSFASALGNLFSGPRSASGYTTGNMN
jgi:hypothetical protein